MSDDVPFFIEKNDRIVTFPQFRHSDINTTMKWTLILLAALCFGQSFSQVFGSKIVPKGKVRYITYPNNRKNSLLYDTITPHGFHSILKQTLIQTEIISNVELRGISEADLALLKKAYGGLKAVPFIRAKAGEQSIVPLQNSQGRDSIAYYPDGTAVFVYPPRDTTWFIIADYDELVFKEEQIYDSVKKQLRFKPIEISLLKRFPGIDQPIVTANINMDLLYELNKDFAVEVQGEQGKKLLSDLEAFLARSEAQYGDGCYYQLSAYDLMRQHIRNGGEHPFLTQYSAYESVPDLGWKISTYRRVIVDSKGEDSVQYNPVSGERSIAFEQVYDSAFYVKKGFERLYEDYILEFDRKSGQWKNHLVCVHATKTLLPGQAPHTVYKVSPGFMNYQDGLTGDQTKYVARQYNYWNNPLFVYLQSLTEVTILPPFEWEEALFEHTLPWKEVSAPEN